MTLIIPLIEVLVCVLIIRWILKQKRGERFSKKFITKSLLLGIAAVIVILVAGGMLLRGGIFESVNDPVLKGFLLVFFTAALIEELFKYVLFRLVMIGNDEVKTIHDAILASCLVALGFTMFEDVYYSASGNMFALLRVLFPAHIVFAALMGYYYAKAKTTGKGKYHVYSLLFPIILHTVFDAPIGIIQIISPGREIQAEGPYASYLTPVVLIWAALMVAFLVLIVVTFIRIKKGANDSRLQEPLEAKRSDGESAQEA